MSPPLRSPRPDDEARGPAPQREGRWLATVVSAEAESTARRRRIRTQSPIQRRRHCAPAAGPHAHDLVLEPPARGGLFSRLKRAMGGARAPERPAAGAEAPAAVAEPAAPLSGAAAAG